MALPCTIRRTSGAVLVVHGDCEAAHFERVHRADMSRVL